MGEAKNIYFTCLNFIRFIKLSISSSSIINPSLTSPRWETVRATTVESRDISLGNVPNRAAEVADLAVVVAVVVVEIATIAVNLATCLAIALNPDLEVDVPTNSATSAKDTATFPVTVPRRTGIRDAMVRFAHRAHHHLSRHQVFHFYGQFVETHSRRKFPPPNFPVSISFFRF